ncbi:MAG: hypothetical protein ABIJ04_05100 [Bacteroidota bacterium]
MNVFNFNNLIPAKIKHFLKLAGNFSTLVCRIDKNHVGLCKANEAGNG